MATRTTEPWFDDPLWKCELVFEKGDNNAIHQFFFKSKADADVAYSEIVVSKDVVSDDAQQLKVFERKDVLPKT